MAEEKIIITIEDNMNPIKALAAVQSVIAGGKVSKDTKGRKFYCWGTTFYDNGDKIVVSTNHTRNEHTSSFKVWKRKMVKQ